MKELTNLESALRYSEQSNWCPKEGDILQFSDQEYKIYRNGKWEHADYTDIVDPSKPGWTEFINKPFRDVKEENSMKESDIEIIERDNNIPPEKSILAMEDLNKIRKDFIKVKGYFPNIGREEGIEVVTREEYDDFRQRTGKALDKLDQELKQFMKLFVI